MLHLLTLQQFRTYNKRTIDIHPTMTVIVGPNAIGKTNILEAMYALAIGKSFRADKESEIISWEGEIARVLGKIEDDTLELIVTHGIVQGGYAPKKKFLVNGVARRQIDFVGKMPAVLFWPEDLSLVVGSPGRRRDYLNHVLMQTDREYRRSLQQYEKGLRQRNKLLFFIHEKTADRSQLPYWDELLIRTGQYITEKREQFVAYVNSLQSSAICYQLEYDKSVMSQERLLQYKDEEIAAKSTLVGPHRDDILFRIRKNEEYIDLAKFGSRGEQRLGVLWCKLGELAYLEHCTEKKPLLLLDDIFSELDHDHQHDVLDMIGTYQTVMTSADPAILNRFSGHKMTILELK